MNTSANGQVVAVPQKFVVPEQYASAPTEWRTQAGNGRGDGYAALFDPLRREIIVERCRHAGYKLDEGGRPIENDQEFCVSVLWARLDQLTDSSALALDRSGQYVEIKLHAKLDAQPATLRMTFADHDVVLIPGSKNDLYQKMDKDPKMLPQRRAYIRATLGADADKSGSEVVSPAASVPTYRLPAPASAAQAN